jgi:hypothetical protein
MAHRAGAVRTRSRRSTVLIPHPPLRRRAIAIVGVLAVAVFAGGASIAAAGSGDPKADAVAAGSAKDSSAAVKPQAADAGVPAGLLVETRRGLDALVTAGTIDQSQADAVQSRVASGSVDTTEVIASGVLDRAQMNRVDDVLRTIKLSYTGP